MNKLKFHPIVFCTCAVLIFIGSCSKEQKIDHPFNLSVDLESILLEKYKKDGITIISIKSNVLETRANVEDNELCKNAYAQICGTENYILLTQVINYKNCSIQITYRLWSCVDPAGNRYLSFQIMDWKALTGSGCRALQKEISDLYWGGAEASAAIKINEMYKAFSETIESTHAQYIAEVYGSPCNAPLINTSFFARGCYKICIDWHYSDEGEVEFGSIIEKPCAESCCTRTRTWCYENGQVRILTEHKGGLTCIRPVSPFPCPERPGTCSSACDRL